MGDGEDQSQRESTDHNTKPSEGAETSPKIIRLVTVIVYLSSVSMAAIILSLYYLLFWNPTVHTGPERLVDPIQLHLSQFYYKVSQKDGELIVNVFKRMNNKMGKNSVCRESTNESVGSEIKFAGNDKEKMYEPKHRRKLVRVLTVVAYLFSVSLAAIMLSLFYVFIYNPGKPAGENIQHQRFSQTAQYKMRKESLGLINETNLNEKREDEPRMLPIKGLNDQLWIQSEVFSKYNQVHSNFSDKAGKENKTV